ncbi:MAG: hypothetical protein JWR38_2816 [Mucilaginibacter sp.]|nr:hypothetical protein [Mucilaginibacter sp.]
MIISSKITGAWSAQQVFILFRSALYDIEKFVREALDLQDQASKAGTARQAETFKSLCTKLKDRWIREIFSSAKEQIITRYIQFHQAGITRMSNDISRRLELINFPINSKNSGLAFYQEILTELELLLSFLRHQCYSYFDMNYQVSIFHGKQHYDYILKNLTELEAGPESAIEQALINAISLSAQESAKEALYSGISYRQLSQNTGLLGLIRQVLYPKAGTSTMQLASVLYKHNLNTLHFSSWFRDYYLNQLIELANHHDKEKWLSVEIKRLSAIFVDPEKSFEQELPSIDQQILPWLQIQLAGIQGKPAKAKIKPNGNGPMPLVLSVPQFAMFIRIFQQTGCFPVPNASRIMRFFTRHFTTKKQPDISIKSFNHAFYSMDQSTAAVVRDYLQKMINYVNKTYFPK